MKVAEEAGQYKIEMDSDNNVTIFDKFGKAVEGKEVSLPLELGENAQLISVVAGQFLEIKGSHYILWIVNGSIYKYYLPH